MNTTETLKNPALIDRLSGLGHHFGRRISNMAEHLALTPTGSVFRRELTGYFATPLAYVFLVIFLILANALTFYMGGFYQRGQADLQPFFNFHPWLYLLLIPALSMRLWAEERKLGTIELLLTLPITLRQAIVGKFLAAWCFAGFALLLTFPVWLTVNYLGDPDNGVIVAGYLGSFLLQGAFLAIGSCLSAACRNQVIAFILTLVCCFTFLLSGLPIVLDLFSGWTTLRDAVASLSFLGHYGDFMRGVIDLRGVIYFLLTIVLWLVACGLVLSAKKAD